MSAGQASSLQSGGTAHMVPKDEVLSMNKKKCSGSIGTANGEVLKAKSEQNFESSLSGGTGPVMPDGVLHVSKFAQNIDFVAHI